MNSLRCLFKKKNNDVSVRIEKEVNKSFTIFLLFNPLFTKKNPSFLSLFGVFLMNGTCFVSMCITKYA